MIFEHSFGIIPIRRNNDEWQLFLVKHQKGHWAFPKGHPEPNEDPKETAARELKEETGLVVVSFFPEMPLEENYRYQRKGEEISKKVLYFLAEVKGEVSIPEEEIETGGWFFLEEAALQITFPEGKALCSKTKSFLDSLTC